MISRSAAAFFRCQFFNLRLLPTFAGVPTLTWTLDDAAELSERRRRRSAVIAVAFAVRDRLRVANP